MSGVLLGEVLVTMFVIMDPVGNVPIFLSVTRRLDDRQRNRAALVAVATAVVVIGVFAVVGRQLLDYLGVSVPALQGAGGLLLLLVDVQLSQPQAKEGQQQLHTHTNNPLDLCLPPLLPAPPRPPLRAAAAAASARLHDIAPVLLPPPGRRRRGTLSRRRGAGTGKGPLLLRLFIVVVAVAVVVVRRVVGDL